MRPPPLDELPESLAAAPPPSDLATPGATLSGSPLPLEDEGHAGDGDGGLDGEDESPALAPIRPLLLNGELPVAAYALDELDQLVSELQPEPVRSAVLAVYLRTHGVWVWSDGHAIVPAARRLVALLEDLEAHGVRRDLLRAGVVENLVAALDWNLATLELRPAAPCEGCPSSQTTRSALLTVRHRILERLDRALTAATLALFRVLAMRDVSGEELAESLPLDAAALDAFVADLVPSDPRYAPLVAANRRYNELSPFPTVCAEPLPDTSAPIGPGEPGLGLDTVYLRLAAEGLVEGRWRLGPSRSDCSEDRLIQGRYPPALESSVRRFQWSRGLPVDGRLDARTLEAMAVPLSELRALFQKTLVALRRSELRQHGTYVRVNLPEYVVELVHEGETVRRQRVAVGYAFGRGGGRTTLLDSRIDSITVNPGWTPSDEIIAEELMPKERAEPGYLRRQRFSRFTRPDGRPGLYQAPGDRNALGRVTINFPNDGNLYLHGTPDDAVFDLAARAVSHGCVRVRDVEALAADLLRVSGTTDSDLEALLDSGKKAQVPLASAVPMSIEYLRVSVEADGLVRFHPNVYRF